MWVLMKIDLKAREPLDHFVHMLMQMRDDNGNKHEVANLAYMVWEGAEKIEAELNALLSDLEWEDLLNDIPEPYRAIAKRLSKELVLSYLTDFRIRIVGRLSAFPCKLLLLAKTHYSKPCDDRQRVCAELRDADDDALHITALKVKWMFRDEIR